MTRIDLARYLRVVADNAKLTSRNETGRKVCAIRLPDSVVRRRVRRDKRLRFGQVGSPNAGVA